MHDDQSAPDFIFSSLIIIDPELLFHSPIMLERTLSYPSSSSQSKSPPRIVEEESVKEVLFETETPISKPQQVPYLTQ